MRVLETLGMTKKESEVYIALLKAGEVGATRLSQSTGIHRVTIYGMLDALIKKGFVVSLKKGAVLHFVAIDPKKILIMLEQKKTEFSSVLSDLESLSNTENKKTVQLYEGERAVSELMADIFGSGSQVYSFGNMDIPEQRHRYVTQNVRKLRLLKKTKIKGITNRLPNEPETEEWKSLTQARVLASLSTLTTWTYIWEGKVANVSYTKGLVGEVIEDEEFANTMLFLWNMLWKQGKKP